MRTPEREKKQVPSALLQKFRLKINIVTYGSCWIACHSRASTAKSVSHTSEIRPSVECQQDLLYFCVTYCISHNTNNNWTVFRKDMQDCLFSPQWAM